MRTITRVQFAWLFAVMVGTALIAFQLGRVVGIHPPPAAKTEAPQRSAFEDTEAAAPGATLVTLNRGTPDEVTTIVIPAKELCSNETAAAPQQRKDCAMAALTGSQYVTYTLHRDDDDADDSDDTTESATTVSST